MISFSDLHDATLLDIHVDWQRAELRCTFRVQIGKIKLVELLGNKLTYLVCPRANPWGESVSVNEIMVCDHNPGHTLKIEMQSGDLIEAKIENIFIVEK